MHNQIKQFVQKLATKFPISFDGSSVLEFGALNINGDVRNFFTDCHFTGVDTRSGPNVDAVSLAHDFTSSLKYSVVFACEMLEHDPHWFKSLQNMLFLTKPGGLMFITCATTGRGKHGTSSTSGGIYGPDPDYYLNLTADDFVSAINLDLFSVCAFEKNHEMHDLYFYGIKEAR